ncbi:cytochrome b5 domain-containing protein 1 [Belonocnema kinseyi]|uniref:cytochrome b5 domain-containing protein 1 n=1 Tax=Belonocnema kinseyi TaxID=2817044 RepID=UPI00143CC59A|nr:cytochrome b5 domain-containing protein 1 [Belonocnema kinseyi]
MSSQTLQNPDTETCLKHSCELPYFLPTEVAIHNTLNDCWVSYLGKVYNLTEHYKSWQGSRAIKPILAHAGKDISHWFDHQKNDIRYYIHPITGTSVPYCPHGPIPDMVPVAPTSTWIPLDKCPWWLYEKYKIGNLTVNSRPCRIINVLSGYQSIISVCEEDTIQRIQERFLDFNANGASYTWKFEGRSINLHYTLTDNGVPDERDLLVDVGLSEEFYIPTLMCYYNDDLTEM